MAVELNEEQRRVLTSGHHQAVRANAGSGKTSVLTMRYIWLIVNEGAEIKDIVAITFTTKAAAEMRERIARLTSELLNDHEARARVGFSVSDTTVISRLDALKKDLIHARISTFHAFCAGLLQRFGHVIGVDPQSSELTEREAALLRMKAIRNAIRSELERDPATLHALYDHVDVALIESTIGDLMRSSEQMRLLAHRYEHRQEEQHDMEVLTSPWLQPFTQACVSCLSAAHDGHLQHLSSGHPDLSERVSRFRSLLLELTVGPQPSIDALLTTISSLDAAYTKEGRARQRKPLTREQARNMEALPTMEWTMLRPYANVDRNALIAAEERQLEFGRTVYRLAKTAMNTYRAMKRERRVLDFDDMIWGAIDLLRDHANIRGLVRRSIRFLLVDEFQDTDPLQYDVIQLLIPDLQDQTRRSAELFIVGDDKQSIYGFRGADVRLFSQAVRDLSSANGSEDRSIVTLATSYRMGPSLAAAVNGLCRQVLSVDTEYDVSYDELVSGLPHDSALTDAPITVFITPTSTLGRSETDDEEPSNEVDHVADRIVHLLVGGSHSIIERETGEVRPPLPGDIAVLARSNPVIEKLASALQARGVPFQAHGGRAFYSRPEVADIRNLLRFCADPDDSLALVAILRSPLVGLTDHDITLAAALGGGQGLSLSALSRSEQSEACSPSVIRAYAFLKAVQEKYHTLTLPDFVRVALNMSHWYGSLNGDPRREQALANIDKLIDQIAEQCRIPGQTIHDVLVSIEDVPWADREPQSMYNLDANAVQIMTIHSAKGLEFPIVILCDLNSKGGWDSIIVTERYGITSALDKSPDELHGAASKVVVPSPSHLLNKHLSSQRSTAEDKRLLYVGATRAEQLLLISLVRKTTKSEELAATHGITDLLRPIYLDSEPTEEQLPSTVSMFTYHVSARKTDHEDLSGLSPWMRTTRALSVTQLLPDHFNAGQTQDEDAAVLGDVIHEVIAEFLSNLGERPVTHDEIVDACRRHSHALGPNALNDAVSQVARALSLDLWSKADLLHCEKLLGAMLGPTLLTGRLDLLLIKGSKARIVDWKTSRISSDELLEHAHFYDIQMKGYAWLVLTTLGIAEVETTLVFTDLIGRSKDYRVDRSYSKTSLPSLGSELQDAVTLRLHTVAST